MHPAEEAVVSPSGHIYSREYILEYLLTKSKELKKVTKAFEAQETANRRSEEQFTPQAKEAEIKEPLRRPPSPCSGRPLRSKDLIPIQLIRESGSENSSGVVRYLCPVTRKTITTQKVILIKSTGALMLEQSAKDLAYPTMTCPITGRPFKTDDVLEFSTAASGFAASGQVEAKIGDITSFTPQYLSAIAKLVGESLNKPIELTVRRHNLDIQLTITPATWGGRGLLGCHLTPM
eukprot:gene22185-28295_t